MISLRKVIFGLLLWQGLACTATAAITALDDEGNTVQLAGPAQRIISLAPSLTELLFAAGAGDRLVGVVEYSDFPEAAKSIPIVGRFDLLDMETILALRPDLIVAWGTGNPRASVNRLRSLGLTVYVAEPKELQSIATHIRRLAQLAGTEDRAAPLIESFEQRLGQLSANYSTLTPVKVFYQVWDNPLITAGGNELINDIIAVCGGSNIFGDISLVAPKVSEEAVLARNPQIIIASGMDQARPEWLDSWLRWPALEAVQRQQLYFIPPELLQRHTPRALDGAEQMCRQIQTVRTQSNRQ